MVKKFVSFLKDRYGGKENPRRTLLLGQFGIVFGLLFSFCYLIVRFCGIDSDRPLFWVLCVLSFVGVALLFVSIPIVYVLLMRCPDILGTDADLDEDSEDVTLDEFESAGLVEGLDTCAMSGDFNFSLSASDVQGLILACDTAADESCSDDDAEYFQGLAEKLRSYTGVDWC